MVLTRTVEPLMMMIYRLTKSAAPERGGSSSYSQEPVTGPYPEPKINPPYTLKTQFYNSLFLDPEINCIIFMEILNLGRAMTQVVSRRPLTA
jgi:hypothetical protein